MSVITFNRFDLGIDLRKGASVSDANRLREMRNMFVTTGLATAKRPGLKHIATLPAGTTGMIGAFGKLQVFSPTAVTIPNSMFSDNVINYNGNAITDIPYCEPFNAYLYTVADFANGETRHFYNGRLVTDSNCPHTRAVMKASSKIFAVGKDGDTVRFSKTGDPSVWTAENDAGFLPTGMNARGDRVTNALGMYKTQLVCLARDGAEVWNVDADPSAMNLADRVENVGTSFPRSVASVGGDLYFLSDYGFRSISMQAYTTNLIDIDVGSPIDSLVREAIKHRGSFEPKAFYFYGTGQYVCAIGNRMFVYSISRTSKVSAWSQYFLSENIDAVAQLGQDLYIRSGDEVYKLDDETYTDNGVQFECLVDLPYMDLKKPGVLKQLYGVDIICQGKCEVSIGFRADNIEAYTPAVPVQGNTRPSGMIPIQCIGTEFAPRIYCYNDQPFELDAITLYYNELGYV